VKAQFETTMFTVEKHQAKSSEKGEILPPAVNIDHPGGLSFISFMALSGGKKAQATQPGVRTAS